jgi:hypothetical protein
VSRESDPIESVDHYTAFERLPWWESIDFQVPYALTLVTVLASTFTLWPWRCWCENLPGAFWRSVESGAPYRSTSNQRFIDLFRLSRYVWSSYPELARRLLRVKLNGE